MISSPYIYGQNSVGAFLSPIMVMFYPYIVMSHPYVVMYHPYIVMSYPYISLQSRCELETATIPFSLNSKQENETSLLLRHKEKRKQEITFIF